MRVRTWVLLAGAVVVTPVVVLGVELQLARTGPPVEGAPDGVDACVGCEQRGPDPRTIVWLGDSTAAGVGVRAPADTLPRQVAEGLDRPVQVLDLAVSGARIADVLDHQVGEVPTQADVVVISVGANDATHVTRPTQFQRDYETLLDRLDGIGVSRIVVLGVPDMGSPPRIARPLRDLLAVQGRRLDDVVRAVSAGRRRVTYVDIAGPTGPPFRRHPDRYFAPDRYHPNAAGYALWAREVVAALDGD